jgi:hypothetical protein
MFTDANQFAQSYQISMKFTAWSDENVSNGSENAFDRPYDPKYQVSITGGKPKKSTLVEKAAKFGRQAFGSRSVSTGVKDESRRPSLPSRYTAVRNDSGLSRYESRLGASISTSSLVSVGSKTRNVRGSVASSIYDEPETIYPTQPLNIVKRVAVPKLPSVYPTSDISSFTGLSPYTHQYQHLGEDDESARHSTDSNDSTRTVTQSKTNPSNSHFSWTTYAETERSVSPTTSYIENRSIAREPDSHFSWTTANTDATYQQDTPPHSPTPSYPTSIMSRRRPVPGREAGAPKRHDSMGDVQDVQEATYEKILPQPPKTRQPVDHVDELESRVESLELQKQNMEKLFKKLEEVDSASPIDVSERMRRENRKKMGEVRIRQDELQRELFEVGRLLSRARAKAEESDGSTGLWLRRVTD